MGAKLNQLGKRSGRRKTEIINEINVTPLVDVMLVLLIVFMVTSPLMIAGISVDLPSTNASPITNEDEPLSVTIDKQGNIYIQNTEVEVSELVAKLKAITKEKTDSRIFVRGDKNIDYGKVMQIIGIINEAGYEKVALVSEIENSK